MLVLCLCIVVVLGDQFTKHLAQTQLRLSQSIDVIPGFFDLTYVQNTGAAFGIFSGMNLFLAIFSLAMLLGMLVFRHHFLTESVYSHVSLGLILAGIIGNLIDRLRWDYVIDFLDFYWGSHHFPAFNVADSAICIGVGIYLLLQFGTRQDAKQELSDARPDSI
ncbi:MAG: signal peptidase II [Verrucomicrobia bacterium]|nr:signal peptidase II [Verrucomicrobiota bacterium]